jgi:hypothetical protein
MEEKNIYTDRKVFKQIKDASRKQYIKIWQDFKNFTVGTTTSKIASLEKRTVLPSSNI